MNGRINPQQFLGWSGFLLSSFFILAITLNSLR
jgi:hypothetical protein